MYGVPYMSAAADESFQLTLRGFSPRELSAKAESECRKHFGECAWRIDEATCVPCMGTLGGHVRLYEARIVASPEAD
jgi:hypothetical protein